MTLIVSENHAKSSVQRLHRLKTRRKLWLQVHLWLGLSLGLFLAVIGLTGSVLVFWQELDHSLNRTLYYTTAQSSSLKSLDEILASGEQAAPQGWESIWLEVPQQADGNYVFAFGYPHSSLPPEQAQSLNIAVDPYTAKVVGQRVFYHAWNPLKHSLVGFFFKLHYALFLGETGVMLVGILAVLFIVSALSGLIIWWSLTGNWRRVLTIKRRASIERFNHDLHQTAGFYSLIVLLALLISGCYFNLPNQFRWLVECFSPLTLEAQASAITTSSAPAILQTALQQAQPLYSGGKLHYAYLSGSQQGLITACFKDVTELQP
jgi:uncharacterized iron-regulated membrane protein